MPSNLQSSLHNFHSSSSSVLIISFPIHLSLKCVFSLRSNMLAVIELKGSRSCFLELTRRQRTTLAELLTTHATILCILLLDQTSNGLGLLLLHKHLMISCVLLSKARHGAKLSAVTSHGEECKWKEMMCCERKT